MLTKEILFEQLKEMGVPQDKPVTIHISLKSVGEIDGRGEGLLDMLIEYVTAKGGLFCVPTHTHAKLYRDDVVTLDFQNPYSCIGMFSKIAMKDERGVRSINPSHSMMIFGEKEKAKAFADLDKNIKTCLSPDGCYGQLYKEDGYILLVGVDHTTNTYLHCVEEMLDLPGRLTTEYVDTTIRYPDGTIEHFPIKTYIAYKTPVGNTSMKFPKYEKAFRYHGCIVDGKIGDAPTQCCRVKGITDVAKLIHKRSGGKDFLLDEIEIDEKYYK